MVINNLSDETNLLKLLHNISKLLRSQVEKNSQKYGLTMPQLSLLKFIATQKETTLSEVAKQAGLSNSTTCGILDRLEKNNIITRERSAQDKRIVVIKLSEQGEQLKEEVIFSKKELLAGLLSQIEPKARKEFIETMEHFESLLEQAINKDNNNS
ncbi:MAG: MarR family transcriptional regulator [Candidatus Riflemargulisbacteria bacterium]